MRSLWFLFVLSFVPLLAAEDLSRWSNDEVEVIRTAVPSNGEPLIVGIKAKNDEIEGCNLSFPPRNGEIPPFYVVVDGVVIDENGDVVDWMEAWDGGDNRTCGIKILEKNDDHDDADDEMSTGFIFNFAVPDGLFGQSNLNYIAVQVHMKDELLTPILDNFLPVSYNLALVPDLLSSDPETHYTGTMELHLQHTPTQYYYNTPFHMHMDGLNVRNLGGYTDASAEPFDFVKVEFDIQKGTIILFTETEFEDDDSIAIVIDFEANIGPEFRGKGLYKELCTEDSDKFCWFTQFESTSARYAFPCIDEPNKKATFDIKVARTEGWNTLSNMPIVDTFAVDGMDGWVWDIFQTTPVMSTYLIAFAIQDFVGVEGVDNVTIWANKEDVDAGLAEYSQQIGPEVINFYSKTFGISFTLPKMDMVSVPKKRGAMENWGLILYSKDTLLYDQESNDVEKKWRVLEVVAHELAHQWFGDLVTMDWWSQTWLNEGFASYVSHLGAEAIDPTMDSWGRMVTHRMFSVMRDDSTDQSWAMSDEVTSRRDIGRKFGSITYSKGASVIRMMEGMLGYGALKRGLGHYLDELQYGNSEEEDLFFHLEVAGQYFGTWPQLTNRNSFEETMKPWTNQAGYPLVTVKKEKIDGLNYLLLSQSWYRDGMEDSTEQIWPIPINFAAVTFLGTDWDDIAPVSWILGETVTLPTQTMDGPIVLNKKATGYYRINYEEENWKLLATTLMTDYSAIHPYNRAQLICDVISLASTGHVTQEIKEQVLEYIDTETEFAPLNAYKECTQERKDFHLDDKI